MLNIPSGIGMGMLFASLSLTTQASAEHRADCSDEQRVRVKAMAAGLNPFFRALGQAFGIAVGQTAFSNDILKRLGSEAGRDVAALLDQIKNLPHTSPQKTYLVDAFVGSLRTVWWILVALTGLSVIMTLFTKEFGLGPVEVVKSSQSSDAFVGVHNSESAETQDGEKGAALEV
jgi:hypothetical protein